METIWKIDFGMNYASIINSMCNQEEVAKLHWDNVRYIKYYYGQLEVGLKYGDCKTIAQDLFNLFGCPMKLSSEGPTGIDIPDTVSYYPNQLRYDGDPDDSDSDCEQSSEEPEFPTEKSNVDYYSIEPDDTPETKRIKGILKELEANEPNYNEEQWYELVDTFTDEDWNKFIKENE